MRGGGEYILFFFSNVKIPSDVSVCVIHLIGLLRDNTQLLNGLPMKAPKRSQYLQSFSSQTVDVSTWHM